MDVRKVAEQVRLRQWMSLIEECQNSEMTVKAWCSNQNINQRKYYYWLKKVREATCLEIEACQNQLKPQLTYETPVFAEVGRLPERTGAITIHLSTAEVEIHNGACADLIENTLRALKSIC